MTTRVPHKFRRKFLVRIEEIDGTEKRLTFYGTDDGDCERRYRYWYRKQKPSGAIVMDVKATDTDIEGN